MPTKKKYTEPKPSPRTPESLLNIMDNPIVKAICNYTESIDSYVTQYCDKWRADLTKRTPSPIYNEILGQYPEYKGTDIDLLGFLMGMKSRLMNVPNYLRRTPTVLRSNEWRFTGIPHGKVLWLVSSQEAQSFSVKILDLDIMEVFPDPERPGKTIERVGKPRNFMVVGYDGMMYNGCKLIQFNANDEEREKLKRYGIPYEESERIFRGKPFEFTHTVFPSLQKIFYSTHYIIPKLMDERYKVEADLYRQRAEDLRKKNIRLPRGEVRPKPKYEKPPKEKKEKVMINNFVSKVSSPLLNYPKDHHILPIISMERNGKTKRYQQWPTNERDLQGILRYSYRRAKKLTWGFGAELRAIPRIVDLSMFLYGFKGERVLGNEILPDWSDGWQNWKRGTRVIAIADNVLLIYDIQRHLVEQNVQEFEDEDWTTLVEDMNIG